MVFPPRLPTIKKVVAAVLLLTFLHLLAGCSSSPSRSTAHSGVPPSTVDPPANISGCHESHFGLSPTVLQHSYDPVKITLAEGQRPLAGDTIVFSPKDRPTLSMFRIKLSALNESKGYELRPVNPRGGGYVVKYLTGDGDEVCSADLTFTQGDDEPTQAHITVSGDNNLRVNWVSASSDRGQVYYQTLGSTAWTRYDETSDPRTYSEQDMCYAPANGQGYRNPGFFHSVTLPNVAQDATVQIKTGSGASRTFTTSPRLLAGNPLRHSVFLVGDLGTTGARMIGGAWGFGTLEFPAPAPDHVLSHMRKNDKIRLSIIYGDVAYASGFSTVWDQFGGEIENSTGMTRQLVTSVGNHEFVSFNNPSGWYPPFGNYKSPDSGGECGVPFTHRPMYSSCPFDEYDGGIADALKANVAPLLQKYNVDLYFTGHLHRTMAHLEKALDVVGYVELDVVSRNELRGSFWGYNASLGDMTVQDTFSIERPQ
ncbi:hypothetical protein FOZ60_005814 [Perkinsus olseni]|uniref:Purple acid phosphatase n=1 Tax=Perkinsus olseni TaxID=32597 RepID=A0A7J6PGM5_PEROL|nr:hypothetical protein FOZ60_005814 [Perkinsus olseni]